MDLANFAAKARQMQAKWREIQENLGKIRVEAESGGGVVKVVANANRQVLKIDIDTALINPNDKEFMQDLIVAAVNKAIMLADERGKEEVKKMASFFDFSGLDFSKMV